MSTKASRSVVASPKVLALLERLHAASTAQESTFTLAFFYFRKYIRSFFTKQPWSSQDDDFMRDKFIALEADKSEFLYLLTQTNRAVNVVEAGTSFGVSTIYLALSVGQNIAASKSSSSTSDWKTGKVIATEKEPTKAAKAREHWKEAGEEVEPWITLLEGDLLETLPTELGKTDSIDLLLLDSMYHHRVHPPFQCHEVNIC
jgi:predicted O-methyltransferase YrrM